MSRMCRIVLAIMIAVIGLAVSTPTQAKDLLKNVPLEWRPTTPINDFWVADLSKIENVTIRMEKFSDGRKDKRLIGENREDVEDDGVLPITTRDDVPLFCTHQVEKLFERVGLQVSDSEGDVVLSGEVKSFMVTETDVYLGDVTFKFELRDKTGKLLWSGLASGGARRWGRSYQAENYFEVLSDSVMEAVFKLLRNKRFISALQTE